MIGRVSLGMPSDLAAARFISASDRRAVLSQIRHRPELTGIVLIARSAGSAEACDNVFDGHPELLHDRFAGALIPKRSMPTTRPSVPTYFHQSAVTPASTATRR